jgi:F-type H+-transporting ATPase subunit delta
VAEAATLARPYAKAAFMSARDSEVLPNWSEALRAAAGLVQAAAIADLLTSPKMSIDQIVSMFAGLGGPQIDAHWLNFVRLLATNKRLAVLPAIATEYEISRAQFENELDVQVTSAAAMSANEQDKLAASLKKRFKRDVRMSLNVDSSLLGGAVIRAGDLVIDGSIKGRLQRLASELGS